MVQYTYKKPQRGKEGYSLIWKNHRLTTGAIVFAITGDPLAAAVAVSGSVHPDAIEGHNYEADNWKSNHRRWSHWFVPYLAMIAALWCAGFIMDRGCELRTPFASPLELVISGCYLRAALTLMAFYPVGCLLHILEDSLFGRVPFFHPTKRTFGIQLFKTRSIAEYAFAWSLSITLIFWRLTWMLSKYDGGTGLSFLDTL